MKIPLAAYAAPPTPRIHNTRRAARSRMAALIGLALAVSTTAFGSPVRTVDAATPSVAHLIGQKLMVAMSGTTPSASLLGRIQRGEVGGVILFGENITTAAALKSLTTKL